MGRGLASPVLEDSLKSGLTQPPRFPALSFLKKSPHYVFFITWKNFYYLFFNMFHNEKKILIRFLIKLSRYIKIFIQIHPSVCYSCFYWTPLDYLHKIWYLTPFSIFKSSSLKKLFKVKKVSEFVYFSMIKFRECIILSIAEFLKYLSNNIWIRINTKLMYAREMSPLVQWSFCICNRLSNRFAFETCKLIFLNSFLEWPVNFPFWLPSRTGSAPLNGYYLDGDLQGAD